MPYRTEASVPYRMTGNGEDLCTESEDPSLCTGIDGGSGNGIGEAGNRDQRTRPGVHGKLVKKV